MSRIYPTPVPRLFTASDGKPSILDPRSYGDIVAGVVAHADHRTRLALWGTCVALYTHLSSHFYHHVKVSDRLSTGDGKPFPYKFKHPDSHDAERTDAMSRYTRVCDIVAPINVHLADASLTFLRTVRSIRTRAGLKFDMVSNLQSPGP